MNQLLSICRLPLRQTLSLSLVLILFVVGLAGCDNRAEGQALATAGIGTADGLAKYYDSLAQDTIDIWEVEAFNSAIRGTSFTASQQRPLQVQIDEMNKRARLARNLFSTYNALKSLSSYDASGAVKESAGNLAGAITSLGAFGEVNPSSIFGNIAGDIAQWKQSKDIRKGSGLILQVLEKIKTLFTAEREAYKSITEERGRKITQTLDFLIRNQHVLALPLLQKVPDALNLQLAKADEAVTNETTIKGLVGMANARMMRMTQLSAAAADNTAQALEGLIENHHNFSAKQGLSLDKVLAGLERAQAYLDEIKKLREGQKA